MRKSFDSRWAALTAALAVASAVACAAPARAQSPAAPSRAEPIQVIANQATILRLAARAQNIIIGDPRILDITVENRSMLVLFGRSPGETNLIVLDSQNREILSVPVQVTDARDRHVSVISATKSGYSEVVYNCTERCVRVATQGAAPAPSGGGGGQAPVPEAPGAQPQGGPAAQPQSQAPEQAPAGTSGGKGYKR